MWRLRSTRFRIRLLFWILLSVWPAVILITLTVLKSGRYQMSAAQIINFRHWRIITQSEVNKTAPIFPPNSALPMTISAPFHIANRDLCISHNSLEYIIIVHTAPQHFQRRDTMRQTWARNTSTSRTAFILGMASNITLQLEILKEYNRFGDIVQGSFIDHYRNLTLKAVMGLRWVSEYCRNADNVIKVDDDVIVNVAKVKTEVFPLVYKYPKLLVCSVEPHAFIFRVGDPHAKLRKWLIPHTYFKGLDKLPMPFCYGYANFYSTSLAADFFEMAKSTPFYRLDDVYVYGILASKVDGLTWLDVSNVFYKTEEETLMAFRNNSDIFVGTLDS